MSKPLRATRQRHAIKQAFENELRPLSPREVLDTAGQEVPNLGIATVYRNIKTMVEQGELVAVDIPGQAPRYALPGLNQPYLFLDEKTDRAYFVDSQTVHLEMPANEGRFHVERADVFFYGELAGTQEAS